MTTQLDEKRIILKIWPELGEIHDNIAEINAYVASDQWRVTCTERLLDGPGRGACFVLFVLKPVASPDPKLERRIVLKLAPGPQGGIDDNVAVINAYLASGWTVSCSEKLLGDSANGFCYVLYLMTKERA